VVHLQLVQTRHSEHVKKESSISTTKVSAFCLTGKINSKCGNFNTDYSFVTAPIYSALLAVLFVLPLLSVLQKLAPAPGSRPPKTRRSWAPGRGSFGSAREPACSWQIPSLWDKNPWPGCCSVLRILSSCKATVKNVDDGFFEHFPSSL